MQKSFLTSIGMLVTMVFFAGLLAFHSWQIHHTQRHVIQMAQSVQQMERAVARLQHELEHGGLGAVAAGGDAEASPTAARRGPRMGGLSAEEHEAMVRPGNLLQARTDSVRAPDAQAGGTLRRAFITDIPGLNPLTENSADVSELYHYVAESLAAQQRDDPDRWIPSLAYRVEVNDDFTEYRVFLKRNVRWHQPAVDLTDDRYAWLREERMVVADDFAFYLELIQNPQVEAAFLRNYYQELESFEVISDHEFVVRWSEPTYQSISFTLGLSPMPRWLYAFDEDGEPFDDAELGRRFNNHWYNQRAIGTGPYRFVSWQQGGRIILERFERYHGEPPAIDRLEFQVISDATARLNNLRAGDVDYVRLLPTQYKNEIMDGGTRGFRTGDLQNDTFQGTSYFYLGWNSERPWFRDRRVRLAMTHAFDRQGLLERNMHNLGRVISGPFFIDGPDYDHGIEPWPYDLQRAAELLTQAGWEDRNGDGIRERIIDGQSVNFEFSILVYGHRPEFIAAMESYRNDLARIGVSMRIQPVEWAIMVQRMTEKDFDAFTGGWVLGWITDLYQIWHSSQADAPRGSNRVGFRHPEADEIIEQVRRTFDDDARRELFRRFHRIVHDEQPYTFWYAPREVAAWRSGVRNVNFSPIRPFDSSMNWFLAQ